MTAAEVATLQRGQLEPSRSSLAAAPAAPSDPAPPRPAVTPVLLQVLLQYQSAHFSTSVYTNSTGKYWCSLFSTSPLVLFSIVHSSPLVLLSSTSLVLFNLFPSTSFYLHPPLIHLFSSSSSFVSSLHPPPFPPLLHFLHPPPPSFPPPSRLSLYYPTSPLTPPQAPLSPLPRHLHSSLAPPLPRRQQQSFL